MKKTYVDIPLPRQPTAKRRIKIKRGEFLLLFNFESIYYKNMDSKLARALIKAAIALIHSTQNDLGFTMMN